MELYASGETILRCSSGELIIFRADGTRVIVGKDGKRIEALPKRQFRPEERPLNVVSTSSEEVGRLMSNFAETPFVLDGKRYASVEAFYVCLKISDPKEKARVRVLHGRQAKAAGRKLRVTETTYRGRTFLLGGEEHHALIKEVIRTKLAQHPELAQDFADTHPRPIVHDTGRPEAANTAFPASAFTRILTELREEIRSGVPTGGAH